MALPIAFQITATGSAQQLPSHPIITGPITLTAKSGNTAAIAIGTTSAVTGSTGYLLPAGQSVTLNLQSGNTNQLWINGTANDVLSVIGV